MYIVETRHVAHSRQLKKKSRYPHLLLGIRVNYTTTISEQLSIKITNFFSVGQINQIARETGFIQRERKVTGSVFAETLIFSKFNNSKLSLEDIAESVTRALGQEISKQAIDKHFTPEAVCFFKKLIEKALQEINPRENCYSFLTKFNEIRIKDSTSFHLPEEMSTRYPGSGGVSSKACIRIQFEYNLKTGNIVDLSLHPFNKQDLTNATETIKDIISGSLIIRDLGYTSVAAIKGIKKQNAFFISRITNCADIYEKKNGKYEKLDFEKVYQYMQKFKLQSIEKEAFITKELEPVRLIIELLPDKIVEQRLKEAKKKGRKLTQAYKAKLKLNLFMTNILPEELTSEQIHKVYTLRWQIELIFKIWKSIGEIHKIKSMKIERFESYLYAKLLWILINWLMVWNINRYLHQTTDKLLSLYKAFKSLKENLFELKVAIKSGMETVRKFIENQQKISSKHHLLDKKKNKNTLYKLIEIM